MKITLRNIGRKLIDTIKGFDMFGVPVSLTYKNDTHFKSLPGGMMTMAIRIGILVYFIQ